MPHTRPRIRIRGQGVAAFTCARLLNAAGAAVSIELTERPRIPAILLGGLTQKLLADLLPEVEWLRNLPRVERRIVVWGSGSDAVTVPHQAVVISEEALAARLRPALPAESESATDWTFYTAPPLPAEARAHHFGARRATAVQVELTPGSDPAACWIESHPAGWLFLIPIGGGSGWLLAVGGTAADLLRESRLVARQVGAVSEGLGEFAANPRIVDPLGGPGWLCGGTAAVAFDPISGDGTGYAIREAILAAAVMRAQASPEELLAHYRARVVAGFKRHLEACRQFYATGGTGGWWRGELARIEDGIRWCGPEPEFRFRLEGFDLIHFSPGLR